MKIRGTFLKDYVKIVNATRDKEWEKFLTEEDWKIVGSMIIPTEWYPAETMGRISQGLYYLLTGESLAFIRGFGKSSAPDLFGDVKQFLDKNDIPAALASWQPIADRYIDEISVTIVEQGPNLVRVEYFPVPSGLSFEHYREVQAGNLEWIIELNGGKDARSEFEEYSRDGQPACVIKVTWS